MALKILDSVRVSQPINPMAETSQNKTYLQSQTQTLARKKQVLK
jgi:hypothetical protein